MERKCLHLIPLIIPIKSNLFPILLMNISAFEGVILCLLSSFRYFKISVKSNPKNY